MSDFKIVQLLNPFTINSNINPKGVYSSSTSYGPGDSVSYGNSSYLCIAPTTGNDPTNTTYWQLLATASTNKLTTTARNNSGSTIPKGSVVFFNGASGNLPTLALSQANSEAASSKTIGITATAIANNSNGEVVVLGLAESLDTSAFTVGLPLWLSATVPGGLTNTEPLAPNHSVYIGTTTRSHPTQGTIEVKVQNGFRLDELHNVSITSVADNQVLKYDSTSGLWKNETLVKADVGLDNVSNLAPADLPISTATQTALNLITNVTWTGDYNNGVTYTVGQGVMFNGASFRMIAAIGAAGYSPAAYPGNWLQVTDYVSPNDIGLGNVNNTADIDKIISTDTQNALDLKQDSLGFTPANDSLSNLGGTAVNNSINPDTNIAHTLGASGLNFLSLATKSILYDDSPNYDVELRNFVDSATKNSLNYEARNLLDKSGSLVLDWDNCAIDKDRFSLTGISFETVSKNLKQYNYSLNYTAGALTSIVYTIPSVGTITKSLNYTSGLLTSVVLSGSTPLSIQLTKTLNYTSGVLTSVAYS
jgi:hypothetical protein